MNRRTMTTKTDEEARQLLENIRAADCAEVASGPGAGSYLAYARQQGYAHLLVVDWTSSAGDWTFLVSKDKETWYLLFQTNNFPRSGFSHQIDLDRPFEGTEEEALEQVFLEIEKRSL